MTNKEKIKELSDSINSDKNLLIRLINEKSNTSPLRDTDNTVELIDFGGGDMNHAMSAWTSTSRDLNDEKIGRIGSLLELLAQNGHGTPFEKSYVQFLVKCDIASHIHML